MLRRLEEPIHNPFPLSCPFLHPNPTLQPNPNPKSLTLTQPIDTLTP